MTKIVPINENKIFSKKTKNLIFRQKYTVQKQNWYTMTFTNILCVDRKSMQPMKVFTKTKCQREFLFVLQFYFIGKMEFPP